MGLSPTDVDFSRSREVPLEGRLTVNQERVGSMPTSGVFLSLPNCLGGGMADTPASEAGARKGVWVRLPP